MDKVDHEIIKELSEDCRRPFSEIGKKIGVSTQTVIKRYNQMKSNGTIQLCAIKIDPKKIGYEGTAHLLITHSSRNTLSETIEQIKKIPNIVIASKAIGDSEGYAVLLFKNSEDLYKKILQIKKLPSISALEVSFAIPGMQYFPPQSIPPDL